MPVELVGLIPAAGIAARISPLPCSKELLPIGYRVGSSGTDLSPKPVCLYLLEAMQSAGVKKAYIVLRQGKWDIPAYLGNGDMVDMNLSYLMMQHPYGAPYTIDEAYSFVRDVNIAFGFPDMLFNGSGIYQKLHEHLREKSADVVLGLFPTRAGQKADMVEYDEKDRVKKIVIKPAETELVYAWITAVWNPSFSTFLHEQIQEHLQRGTAGLSHELFMGNVLQSAVDQKMNVATVRFPDHTFYDIGTTEGLLEANASIDVNGINRD
jgi:glucose-1-phosphate thymidylyltransferase